jgi:hypothetical protein
MNESVAAFMLVVLVSATSAHAFNFNQTNVIEVTAEVSPRMPLWQSAVVEKGDSFSQYCADFLRSTYLNRYYSLSECREDILAVNGYKNTPLNWIVPSQIVWLPSPQNVRLVTVTTNQPFVNVDQLCTLLGLDALEAEVAALPNQERVNEMVRAATRGMTINVLPEIVTNEVVREVGRQLYGKVNEATREAVNSQLPELVTNEVDRQLGNRLSATTKTAADNILPDLVKDEVRSQIAAMQPRSAPAESKAVASNGWWGSGLWVLVLALAILALVVAIVSLVRPIVDKPARQSANDAKTKVTKLEARVEQAASKADLQAVDKKVHTAQETANEAGELAASAMSLLCFGDFKVVGAFPSQTAVELLQPGEKVVVTLAHVDNEHDVRVFHFTCIANAFDDGRDGLKIVGITSQRRPIAKRRSSIASALANGAKANHLQGVEEGSDVQH